MIREGPPMIRNCGATLVLGIVAWSGATTASAQDFYAGKQLTIMVGAGPGGGMTFRRGSRRGISAGISQAIRRSSCRIFRRGLRPPT